mgnify:FL=1
MGTLVGLFGGTFDPIHEGHIAAAQAAMKALELDEVIFVPAGDPYLKSVSWNVTPAAQRQEMVRLALLYESVNVFKISDAEIIRDGPSYTLDTARELGSNCGNVVVILGMDAVLTIPRWHDPAAFLSECRVAAITRPCSDLSDFYSLPIDRSVGQIELVIADTPMISSTEIRRCVLEGRDVEGVCPPVEEFIRSNGLYT